MELLSIDCPDEIQEEVARKLQVLQSEHKVHEFRINKGY